jgi:hypothetical protein
MIVGVVVVVGLIRSLLFRRNERRYGMKPEDTFPGQTIQHPDGPGGTASR